MMRSCVSVLIVLLSLCGCGGASGSPEIEGKGSVREAREVLSHMPWRVSFAPIGREAKILAGTVEVGRHSGFRFVVLVRERKLRKALAVLPARFRPLLLPDFGEATLLGSGPYVFVANAGKRTASEKQVRAELTVRSRLESALCRASSGRDCPPV
jgi:hypothetical protein